MSHTQLLEKLASSTGKDITLHDDAVCYSGSATWDMWENHIPVGLVQLWPLMSRQERLVAFLVSHAVTGWDFQSSITALQARVAKLEEAAKETVKDLELHAETFNYKKPNGLIQGAIQRLVALEGE